MFNSGHWYQHLCANSSATNKPKPFVTKLVTWNEKEAILAAGKLKRQGRGNSAQVLSYGKISNQMLISKYSTFFVKIILKQAKSKWYKFVRVRNGIVYARHDESSRVEVIENETVTIFTLNIKYSLYFHFFLWWNSPFVIKIVVATNLSNRLYTKT